LNEPNEEIQNEIRRFVADVRLTSPALINQSVFATHFEQLFYEKWRNGALARAKNALTDLRERVTKRFSEEIEGLRELVTGNDITLFLAREEQKLRLLEAMAMKSLEESLQKRATSYANVSTRGLLKSFQTICGDNVTLQKSIREKRAAVRAETMELRLAQSRRMEKLQKYHAMVMGLEEGAVLQTKIREGLEVHGMIERDLKEAEEDRQALLKQREKVRLMLEEKRAESNASVDGKPK
jgi:hypothetical protein